MPVLHTLHRAGVLLLAAALYATSAPAAAADEPGWTAEPAAGTATAAPGSGRPSSPRPYFYLEGAPGTVLEDRLALSNTGDRERTVTLRGADAYNTPDGAFAVRPGTPAGGGGPLEAGTGAGAWISFGAGATVKIPPRTRAVVPFTVTVPPATPPGDHPAVVVATEAGREAWGSPRTESGGVRVHLRVSGPTLAALTVEDVAVRGEGAAAVVAYTLVNRGNVALAPELEIRAEGRFGEVPGRGSRALPVELLPGRRVELTEPWPGAPVLDRVRVTVTVTAPGGARATGSASAWFVPWRAAGWTGLGLLALGGTTLAALFLVRGRRIRPDASTASDAPDAPDAPDAQNAPDAPDGAVPGGASEKRGPAPAPEHELTGVPR
ncbi:COG1470 family protein [Streptomyces sp. NPDC054849]